MSIHIRYRDRKAGMTREVWTVPEDAHRIPDSVREDMLAYLTDGAGDLAWSHRKWIESLSPAQRADLLSYLAGGHDA